MPHNTALHTSAAYHRGCGSATRCVRGESTPLGPSLGQALLGTACSLFTVLWSTVSTVVGLAQQSLERDHAGADHVATSAATANTIATTVSATDAAISYQTQQCAVHPLRSGGFGCVEPRAPFACRFGKVVCGRFRLEAKLARGKLRVEHPKVKVQIAAIQTP